MSGRVDAPAADPRFGRHDEAAGVDVELLVRAAADAVKKELRDKLVAQIAITEDEFEKAKSVTYRAEGALLSMRHMLEEMDEAK